MKKTLISAACVLAMVGCGAKDKESEAKTETADVATSISSDASENAPAPAHRSVSAISAEDLMQHIRTLAADDFEGRAPGTPGGEKTKAYIAAQLENVGFEPVNGSYFQPVPMVEATVDPEESSLIIASGDSAQALKYKDEAVFWTKRVEDHVSFQDSEVVFVGYGVVAPEYGWNDYEGMDVTGKTVIMLINDPGFAIGDEDLFNGEAMTYYGRWTYKFEEAARQGAAAALIIHDTKPAAYGWGVVEGSWSGPQLDLERNDGAAGRVAMEGWIANDVARNLMAKAGLDLDELQEKAKSADFTPIDMGDLVAWGKLKNEIRRSESANVLGVLPGSQAPDEYVLYMGHWDHLGVNPTEEGEDKIFNGAVDNATGIAAILEIAEKFATNETRPRRSILVAAVTAEESGLLGSAYMAENPPVALGSIVGGLNIDAILPTPRAKDVTVVGYGASELEDFLKAAAEKQDRYLRPDAEPEKGYFYRSDHISLAKKGVPMLYADQGVDMRDGGVAAGEAFSTDYVENRYHNPADEFSEDWEMSGMTETVELLYETGAALAYGDAWPNWYEGNEFRALRDAQRAQ